MIHIAAVFDPDSLTQSCARCGAVLIGTETVTEDVWKWDLVKGYEVRVGTRERRKEVLFPRYAAGTLVETSRHAISIPLTAVEPTCQRRTANQDSA